MSTTTDTPAAGETATRFDAEFRKRVLACWRELGAAVAEYTALRAVRPAHADPSAESPEDRLVRARALGVEHRASCAEDVARFRKMLEAHDPEVADIAKSTWLGEVFERLVEIGIPWPQRGPDGDAVNLPPPDVAARGRALEVALELLHPTTRRPMVAPSEDDVGVMFEWRGPSVPVSLEIEVTSGSEPVTIWGRLPDADKGFYGTPEEVGAQLDAALTLLDAAV